MIAQRHDLAQDQCASRALMQTKPCKMLALLSETTLNVPYCRPWRMVRLRQCFAVLPAHHPRWEAACAHSETMGMEDVVAEVVRVEGIVVGPLLFLRAIGNEERDYQMEAIEVEVAGVGHHTER